MMDPLPSINKVFALVVQEERQRNIGSGSHLPSESMVFGTNSTPAASVMSSTAKS